MTFELPQLPYLENALEPVISQKTISFHYGKHHATYLKNLNDLIKDSPLSKMSLEDIIVQTAKNPSEQAIFNNAAQVWNHTFYWNSLCPASPKITDSNFLNLINRDFGGIDNLKDALKKAALAQFASGWAWLVSDNGTLKVMCTPNAENPLMTNAKPLLCIDVWEHAYYLDWQNKRADYLHGLVNQLINWDFAIKNLNT